MAGVPELARRVDGLSIHVVTHVPQTVDREFRLPEDFGRAVEVRSGALAPRPVAYRPPAEA